jgi:RNA polymerase sigma-70 factor (ECF subfamily)
VIQKPAYKDEVVMQESERIDNGCLATGIGGTVADLECPALPQNRGAPNQYPFTSEYVRKLADGDADVESHFVTYFSGLLFAKLRFHLRSGQEIQDLQQEVFYRVLRSLRRGGGLQNPERLGAYVYAVCNNVVMEHFRNKSRMVQFDPHLAEPTDPRTDAQTRLVTEEDRSRVRSLVAELAPKDRKILKALFLDEREKDSICREFGVSRGYLRVLLHRASERFRRLLSVRGIAPAGYHAKG